MPKSTHPNVTATLDCVFDKTRCDVSFDFTGFDEGDDVSGQGWAEMTRPDTITGEIEFLNGGDTTFEASPLVSATSSAAC